MTPILYEKDEIDFTSQGIGSLVEIYDVDVEEQRNGLLQLTASYPVSGMRYADISVGRIILAKPNQRDDVHAFRIISTELDISGYAVTIEADSITYDLTHNIVKHLNVSGNGQSFMTALKNAIVNPSIFSFYSDISTSSTTSLNYVNPMEAIMGTIGSFLQIWGGELKRENRRVAMFNRRGRDNVATFRLGKNIAGLKYSVDISSLVTRIIPTKSVQNDDQTTTTLEGTPVDSRYINNYEQIYTLPLEFTDDAIKTVADLNAAAKGWFTKSANTGRDKPTVTIDIDVLSLQDSADYQDKFKNLESVSLTDTVTVYVPEYGVNVTAIVNELHYDPILDRVTKMTVGTAKQSFADSSRTQLSDLQDKIISVKNQADAAAVSANGKSTNYYGSVEPSHPQEGDTWFWVNGDKSGIKQFVNGDWVDLVDSDTQEKIADAVTDAVTQAKAHTATAIEQNNASQQEVMNDIAKSQAGLAIKDGDFNNKAQAMADKALSDAKANTVQVAQETLNSANDSIAQAKYAITDAYKNADGVISKKVDDTATSIGNTISQNKIDSDGKISTAQSTATQALNEVTTKVSQTVYDQKTGDLTQAISKAQQTADGVVSTVGNYKTSNDKRVGAAESTIEQNSKDITARVSQTDYDKKTGELSEDISTLQQTAEGFDAMVTKVDNLSVGGRNYVLNSNVSTSSNITGFYSSVPSSYFNNKKLTVSVQLDYDNITALSDRNRLGVELEILNKDGSSRYIGSWKYPAVGNSFHGRISTTWDFSNNEFKDYETNQMDQGIYVQGVIGTNVSVSKPKLEIGTSSTDWTPAPEDATTALAQVKITADGVSDIVSNPTTGLSTRVQTAEGTLSTVKSTADGAMSKASQTANDITQEIKDRGTGDSNTLQSAKNFTQSTITSYDSGIQSQLTQTNDAFLATVSANNLIVDSSLTGSAATNSIVNWTESGLKKWYYSGDVSYKGIQSMGYNQKSLDGDYSHLDSISWSNFSFTGSKLNVSVDVKANTIGSAETDYLIVYLIEADADMKRVMQTSITGAIKTANSSWVNYRKSITVNSASKNFYLRYQMRGNGNVYVARPYVGVQELVEGSYTAGTNNNNQTILSLFKDNWSIGITDNIGAITSGIVGNSSSMSLISKNIVLDGNTTVTGDFYAKGGNFKNLNASNLTVGTLNGNQVNITNINASNIVSGAISGANLNINLNTGSVVFQKGRINSSDYTTDINIDQGYISAANGDTRALLTQGKLQLIDPTLFSPQTNPYLEISNSSGLFNGMAALVKARDSLTVSIDGYDKRGFDLPPDEEKFVGLSIGKYSNKLMATKIGGAEQGVIISGGKQFDIGGYGDTPYIYVGSDSSGRFPNGDRVSIHASYFHSKSTYLRTTSGSANVVVNLDGALVRASSARKYKLDIKNNIPIADSLKLIDVPLSTWVDKHEHEDNASNERYFGMIAEDLRDAGLEYLVQYGDDNEVEGINYDRVALLLIPLVKELKERIEELERKGK